MPTSTLRFLKISTLALALGFSCQPVWAAGTASNANTWLKSNPLVPEDGFMVNRVQMIFEDVKRASDSAAHPSQLYIIQSNNIPWAIALQDKNVILTSGAIDVIYSSDDSLEKKDARMAFVLGHELKHVIDNDFSHEQAYKNFSNSEVSQLVTSSNNGATNRKTLELLADEEGLINASLAGYDTSAIFSDIGDADNFLDYWATQTNTNNSSQHHSPRERIDYLKASYKSIDNLVEFFKYGVRLAHFGDHSNAQVLLDDFYKVYESNRVLTNRGFVQLQLARAQMPAQLAYRYWFPDTLDLDSGFPVSASRNLNTKLSRAARRHLEQAVALLNKGLDFSQDDLSTRMNLITAHLFLGEYSAARAVIERIDGWDMQPQLLALDATIVMQDKRLKDPWNTYSLERLEELASEPDAALDLVYNYARILQEYGKPDNAMQLWEQLAANLTDLPKNYQVMVCRQLADRTNCARQIASFPETQSHWKLQIKPGDQINSRKTRKFIQSWKSKPITSVSGIDAKIYPDGEGNSLLVLDGTVKLVTIKQHGIDFVQVLQERFGAPRQVIDTGPEQIWSYGPQWSALVSGNEVREIWVAQ